MSTPLQREMLRAMRKRTRAPRPLVACDGKIVKGRVRMTFATPLALKPKCAFIEFDDPESVINFARKMWRLALRVKRHQTTDEGAGELVSAPTGEVVDAPARDSSHRSAGPGR